VEDYHLYLEYDSLVSPFFVANSSLISPVALLVLIMLATATDFAAVAIFAYLKLQGA
jgi:hypothetical protein